MARTDGDTTALTIAELTSIESAEGFEVRGLEESLEQVARVLRDAELAGHPYDGLLGFSQGGYLVHRVAALAASGDRRFHDSFRFAMMVGGYPDVVERVFCEPGAVVAVPSCHVFGDNEAAEFLPYSKYYAPEQRLSIRHQQGHVFPVLDASQTELLRDFLRRYSADPPASTSQPAVRDDATATASA